MADGNGEIKIEKGVPLSAHGNRKYPFADMEPGDSFFVARAVSFGAIIQRYRKKGNKFVTRVVTENGVKGTRVWRVS